MGISSFDYHARVCSLANEITDDVFSQVEKDSPEVDDLAQDLLHEYVDGTDLVIYNHYHLSILEHSRNCDYMIDNLGLEEAGHALKNGGLASLHQALAYWALYADVSELVQEKLDR